jgi:flavodoxin
LKGTLFHRQIHRKENMKKLLSLAAACAVILSGTVYAGQADTTARDKKVLVAYYSKTGNTERVAKDLAAALYADIEKLVDQKNRKGFWAWFGSGRDAMKKRKTELGPLQKDPANYDLVIVGTPVWAWHMTPAVRTYLAMEKGKLKRTAYFVTSGNTPAEKIVPFCEEVTGKKAATYAGFTAKELKDDKIYREKLSKFVEELNKTGTQK